MKPIVKLSYWTRSDTDFVGLNELRAELDNAATVVVDRNVSDECGGWLFQIALEIYNDLSLHGFLSSYVEDLAKIGLGFAVKETFSAIKQMFAKNHEREPDFSEVRFRLNDAEVVLYSTYEKSIEDVFDDVISELHKRFDTIKLLSGSAVSVHIPIFYRVEKVSAHLGQFSPHHAFEIAAYRTRLTLDESIPNFSRNDYFKFWGVRSSSDFIYDLTADKIIQSKFYLEPEYSDLWGELYKQNLITDIGAPNDK